MRKLLIAIAALIAATAQAEIDQELLRQVEEELAREKAADQASEIIGRQIERGTLYASCAGTFGYFRWRADRRGDDSTEILRHREIFESRAIELFDAAGYLDARGETSKLSMFAFSKWQELGKKDESLLLKEMPLKRTECETLLRNDDSAIDTGDR